MWQRRRFVLAYLFAPGLVLFLLLVGPQVRSLVPASGPRSTQTGDAVLFAQDDLPMTRWVSVDGRMPTTFAEWQAQQPPPVPRRVQVVYTSARLSSGAAADRVVCALVNPSLYEDLSAALAGWVSDVESEGWSVIIYSASFPDPPSLRDHLANIADLEGCLLIGDFPIPWYKLGAKELPFDVFYMDLDGTWHDDDGDGLYEDHTGDVVPEIWVGRLLAGNLTFGADEVSLVNNYFAKNRAYRAGRLALPARALVYVDDDWAHGADSQGQVMSLLFPDTTVVSDRDITRAEDYGRRLVDYYAWIHLLAHSTAKAHHFTYNDDDFLRSSLIYNDSIYELDPHAFFYNLFACGVGRFIEQDYIAGWYVFADSYGLAALGSTTSGGMVRGFPLFHGLLAEGKPLGEAYLGWFAVEGIADPGWHYGLTLLGDPTLIVATETPTIEAPAGLVIAGPTRGTIRSSYTLTATVNPPTATQPVRYTWEAGGQVPVTCKGGSTDTAALGRWTAPGEKTITVTATNAGGTVTGTHVLTVEAPEIAISPGSYHETLAAGETLTRSLLISNTGQGDLVMDLVEADWYPAAGNGHDAFGYVYRDSNESGGPAYRWTEIAPPAGGDGIGLELPAWGFSEPISLPFKLDFYGKDYTELTVQSHGALTFRNRSSGRENVPLPSPRAFEIETLIAPFWDFLVIDPGAVYYQRLDSMFIVEYYQIRRYGGTGTGTWEVILFDNGSILFQYQDVDFQYYWGNQGQSATVGIQGDAMTGLEYSYNAPALSDGLAICFAYPGQSANCSLYVDVPWLSQSPAVAVVASGTERAFDVVFDANVPEVSKPGEYEVMLVLSTNDLDEGLVAIPVTMEVLTPIPPRHDLFLPLITQ